MAYAKVPADHSEFGGGDGLIDAERRRDRAVTSAEERMEIMATNPLDPEADPATTPLGPPWPAPYEWPDPATAEGTQ